MPFFKSIIGQKSSIRLLSTILKNRTIPNALLFTGPEGVGKQIAAIAFAMAANCSSINKAESKFSGHDSPISLTLAEPCGLCKSCRKFESGSHPDFIRIDPSGQVTKISQIRDLRQIMIMKPFEATLRVVLISEAHTLNQEASNALLKVLEEPPDRTLLILIASQKFDLLPTIVSRCQEIRFHPIPKTILAEALIKDFGWVPEEAEILSAMSNGSLSKALALKNTDHILYRNWIIKELETLESWSIASTLALAEKLGKNKEKLPIADLLEMIKVWFRDLVVAKYCLDKIINKDLEDTVRNNSKRYHQKGLLDSISAVDQARKEMDANVNPRLVLETLFLTLAETIRE